MTSFIATMKQRAMILTQAYLRPYASLQAPCIQWKDINRFTHSLVQIKSSSNVYTSRAHPGLGHRVVIAKSQVGAASGTEEENRISYEELGRYGIDISDYADIMYQVSEEHSKAAAASSKSNKKQKRKAPPYEVVDRTKDDPEDSDDLEFGDDGEVGENDWCTYLILSHDKRKTYCGVTANLTRRLRQHNGELAGGAKSVRGGRPWSLVWTVRGFGTRSEACQFEWRLRNFAKGYLDVDEALFKEIPSNYQDSHVILRRWAAFKKVHETMDDWKHMRVEWH